MGFFFTPTPDPKKILETLRQLLLEAEGCMEGR